MYGCAMRLFGNQINKGKGRWFLDASTQTRGKRKEKKEMGRGHTETCFWSDADGQRTVTHKAHDR